MPLKKPWKKNKPQKQQQPQIEIEEIPDLPWKGLAEIAEEACQCLLNAECNEICSIVFDINGMAQITVGHTIHYRPSWKKEFIECRNHYHDNERRKQDGKRVNAGAN